MSNDLRSGQIACQVDFGNERQFELDFPAENNLSLLAGSGIETIHVWSKSVAGKLDLRINVTRTRDGIELVIDQGQQDAPWWAPEDCPRLTVAVASGGGSATVTASSGHGEDLRQAVLGRISLL